MGRIYLRMEEEPEAATEGHRPQPPERGSLLRANALRKLAPLNQQKQEQYLRNGFYRTFRLTLL